MSCCVVWCGVVCWCPSFCPHSYRAKVMNCIWFRLFNKQDTFTITGPLTLEVRQDKTRTIAYCLPSLSLSLSACVCICVYV